MTETVVSLPCKAVFRYRVLEELHFTATNEQERIHLAGILEEARTIQKAKNGNGHLLIGRTNQDPGGQQVSELQLFL
jgi:hypothetical protein